MNALTIPVAVFQHKEDRHPVRHDLEWPVLAERLCKYDERQTKDGRAWSPVTYRPGTTRGQANVEQVHALVLDIDHNDIPTDLLGGLEYVAHTTFSHTPDDPRWRVVLPLTRPVEGEDWPNFWLRANAYFGGCVDPQTKDRSRIFFLPSCRPEAVHEFKTQHGLLLDPSSLPDVPQYAAPEWTPPRNGTLTAVPSDTLVAWAQRFAGAKINDLAHMGPNSGRNAACNRLAYLLAGLVADGQHGIDADWVAAELFAACESNHLVFEDGERSVRNTIASGMTAGANRPWSPADRDEAWTPSPPLTAAGLAVDPETGEVLLPARRFTFLTADQLKNRPDPEWLTDGVVQQDTLLLIVGAQETYKTFVALDLALSVGEGRPWQGHPCKQGTVVYVSAEGGSGLGLRISAWEISRQVESTSALFLADQAPQFLDGNRGGDVDELLLSLGDLAQQPALIIVDTLARVMVGHDENSAEDMGMLIATADRIRRATGATVGLVHHNNKQGGARGSSALLGAVHTIIECSREPNSRTVVVKCGKQKDGDHFPTLMLQSQIVDLGVNEATGQQRSSLVLNVNEDLTVRSPDLMAPKPGNMQALEVLIEKGSAVYSDWRDACNLPNTTFRRVRQELITDGFVEHLPDGLYQPTQRAPAGAKGQGPTRAKQGPMALGPEGQKGGPKGPYVVEGPWPLGRPQSEGLETNGDLPW